MQIFFEENKPIPDIYFICVEERGLPTSLNIAKELRLKGFKVISDPIRRSMKAQMREANKLRARYVLILGEKEMQSETLIFKNLENSKQESVKQQKIIEFFDNLAD